MSTIDTVIGPSQAPVPRQPFLPGWLSRAIGLAPIIVGLAFLYYGWGKVMDLNPTILSIKFLTNNILVSKALAFCVTAVDLYLAALLLLAGGKRSTVKAALICLGVYSVFLGYLVSMQNPPNCGCGGMMKFFVSNRANAAVGLTRNLCLSGYLGVYYYFKIAKRQ